MMTGLLHEKEFSRKTFLKGGGALIVGFCALGALGAANARAVDSPYASNGPFDQYQVDSWIAINADNTASLLTGGILQGTGSDTGLLMIAGEELNMDMSQLEFVMADTAHARLGEALREQHDQERGPRGSRGGRSAARCSSGLASTQLGVPCRALREQGRRLRRRQVRHLRRASRREAVQRLDAGELEHEPGQSTATFSKPGGFQGGIQPGQSPAKPMSQYTLVGTRVPRIDIPAIVTGSEVYIQNIRVPGMLHGRGSCGRAASVLRLRRTDRLG